MCVSSQEVHPSVNSLLFETVRLGQAELRGELSPGTACLSWEQELGSLLRCGSPHMPDTNGILQSSPRAARPVGAASSAWALAHVGMRRSALRSVRRVLV